MAEDWLVKGRSRNERFSSGRSSKDNACNAQPQVFVSNSQRLNQHLGFPCQSFGLTTLYNSSLFDKGITQEVHDKDMRKCSSIDHYSLMIGPKIALTGRIISNHIRHQLQHPVQWIWWLPGVSSSARDCTQFSDFIALFISCYARPQMQAFMVVSLSRCDIFPHCLCTIPTYWR